VSYVYNDRHGGFVNRSMTVKTSVVGRNTFTGKDIKAYNIDEAAQWVSLWRRLSLSTRWYAGGGAAVDRSELHDLGAGTAVPRDERVLGLVAGVEDEPDPVPLGGSEPGPAAALVRRNLERSARHLHG